MILNIWADFISGVLISEGIPISYEYLIFSINYKNLYIVSVLLLIATASCVIMIFCNAFSYLHHKTYIVQLDDNISVNEMFNSYDNIEHKYANIYEVRELQK